MASDQQRPDSVATMSPNMRGHEDLVAFVRRLG
jgi:hypothetical protein